MIKKTIIGTLNKFGFYRLNQIDDFINCKKSALHNEDYSEILLNKFFKNLQSTEFRPRVVYDIGAHCGSWTRKCMEFYSSCDYHLFEPQLEMKDKCGDLLEKKNINWHSIGISDVNTVSDFFVLEKKDSSTFRLNKFQKNRKNTEVFKVRLKTIDYLVTNDDLPKPDILKIDAEGFDLNVLRGSKNILGKTEVILIECAVCNIGTENTILEIVNYLDKHNYRIFDITSIIRPKDNISFLWELSFVLKNGTIDNFNYFENS